MFRVTAILDRNPFLLSLIAGAVSATGFEPLGLWPVSLLMLALWIEILSRSAGWRGALFSGWLFGLGHFIVGLNWIATAFTFQSAMPEWLGYIAVVLLSFYLAVYPALAGFGACIIGRDRPFVFVIALAAMWIISEWLRSWVFSGFIWNPLGNSLPAALWTEAQYVGVFGLAGLAMLLAGGIWISIRSLSGGDVRQFIVMAAAVALVSAGLVAHGQWDQSSGSAISSGDQPNVTVVQPNIGQQDKWRAGYEQQNFSKLAELTERTDDKPRLIFWPEAAIPDYLESGYPERYYFGRPPELVRDQLASLMKPGDVLVLGALKLEFDQVRDRAVGARNSVFVMNSDRELLGRYDKAHLVPYGEYLPMRPLLEAIGLSRLAPGYFDFWPGPGPRSLDLGGFGRAGMQVCYEIIFPGDVADDSDRPDFLFNPSNDAWFGSWGPPQHLAQARFRAIEEGLPVIRSTPTGISAIIDAHGRVVDSIPMGEAGRIDGLLPAARDPTLFSRYGNMVPLGLALILLISAIAIRQRGR